MRTIRRRDFVRSMGIGAGVLALSGCHAGARSSAKHPPNILFIMADDHAAHALSCYGSTINRTPNLDRIAQEGVRLDNCFCTNSICAPSRAAILTGKYSHKNGLYNNAQTFDGSQPTFPKLLQHAGYQTAIVGKWHLKSDPTGFHYWNILPGQGEYHNPELIEMGRKKRHTGYVTDLITDFSIRFLEDRDTTRPFCLLTHHKAPHRNWQPDLKHAALFEEKDIPLPATYDDDYNTRGTAAHEAEMRILDHLDAKDVKSEFPQGMSDTELKYWKYQRYIKDYLRTVASIDENTGRLLDYLDRAGLTENTLVIYTSDQGFFLGDHGWFDKRFMYEESLRMPFIARFPQEIRPGSSSDAMVLNVDFAPTLLSFAGRPAPDDMQGRSARTVLAGRTPRNWRTTMYYHYYEYPSVHMVRRHYGVRTNRHKLIHFYGDVDEWELYDIEKDPHELHNVYSDPAYAAIRNNLENELRRLRAELEVPEQDQV